MKIMTRMTTLFDRIIENLALLAIVCLNIAWFCVSLEVVARYFFRRPQAWAFEITEYASLFICFLSSAWVLKKEGHVHVDLVFNYLNSRNQALLNTATSVLGTVVCFVLMWYSAKETWDIFHKGVRTFSVMNLPQGPIIAIIPVGFFLLFIQFLRRAYGHLRSWLRLGRGQNKK